ncbi:hypothetical protein F909_03608 [Acinetobacter sp. ANC 3929]|jgi:hypothetical protein|uniref:hypothetical protein n=1 Tax=Acinetobacter TaxID=469 RepID=UPI0002CF7396|nr:MULTISPECIES: hypothetical protein [Acinetobacter]ENW78646.1 hypothetical protein F909_03608 [Acinetobacter sp. ANC 3929]MCH7290997.1 hypothetical protein [Acinetobacter genomosp. 15BJ]MCH7318688.1 hypothetical protein [Acinetobacter higginsii]
MRQKNNDWLLIIAFIVFVIFAVAINTWNTVQVCKGQDVYWVNGTQHTCKFFK